MKKIVVPEGLILITIITLVVLTAVLIALGSAAVYAYFRTPLRAEWDEVCVLGCTKNSACIYVESWEWKGIYCRHTRCDSLFSAVGNEEFFLKVPGEIVTLAGGNYIYDSEGPGPFTLQNGPVEYCPTGNYPGYFDR
jgi:hypothetical protein